MANETTGTGYKRHLAIPLFIAVGSLILAIPIICILVNFLHHRKQRARNSNITSNIQNRSSPPTRVKTSWHRLSHRISEQRSAEFAENRRSEYLEMERLRRSQQYGEGTDGRAAHAMKELERAKVRFLSTIKSNTDSFDHRISTLNPFSVRLPHPQPQPHAQQPTAEDLSIDIEAFAPNAPTHSKFNAQSQNHLESGVGRSASTKTFSSTATTIVSPRTRAASIKTAQRGSSNTIARGNDGFFQPPPPRPNPRVLAASTRLSHARERRDLRLNRREGASTNLRSRNPSGMRSNASSGSGGDRFMAQEFKLERETLQRRREEEREKALRMLDGREGMVNG